MNDKNLIGGAWLAAHLGIDLVMPLNIRSRIGGRRATHTVDGLTTETYVASMRPSETLRGHLTFLLKHEVPHFELLSRLFQVVNPPELKTWIADEPSSQYARRAGFLFEFFTGRELDIDAKIGGHYIDALDDQKLVTASPEHSIPNPRWRVRDNLPGTRNFCPMLRKTPELQAAMALDIPGLIQQLSLEFGDDLLMRSAVWMTLRESKSSFAIEGEADQSDRIQRFADVLARRTGQGSWPLDNNTLAELQNEILGQRTTLQQLGLRQSPVFVGEVVRYQEIVHYIAPPPEDIGAMLDGLVTFLKRTEGQSSVMRSTVGAFGFVYIHPLADGNGRVHRFLINDILRRDAAVKDPLILPVSSMIASEPAERRSYARILDQISLPLMQSMTGLYHFASDYTSYPDGVRSNFNFRGTEQARPVWRHLDLTSHAIYLAHVINRTICDDMRNESVHLRNHAIARAAIKEIIEIPDMQIDRLIRSVEANPGKLSNVLSKEMPALAEAGVWDAVVQAIRSAFRESH